MSEATVPLNHILRFLPLENMKKLKTAYYDKKNYNYIFNTIIQKRENTLKTIMPSLFKKLKNKKFKTNYPTAYGRNNYKFYKNILGSIRQVPLNTKTKKVIFKEVTRNMKPHPLNYNVLSTNPNRTITNYNLKIGNNILRAGLQKNYMSGYRAKYVNIFIKQPNNTYILHRANRKGRHEYNNSNNLVYHPYLTGPVKALPI